jgi:hypothetical protein
VYWNNYDILGLAEAAVFFCWVKQEREEAFCFRMHASIYNVKRANVPHDGEGTNAKLAPVA